MNKKASKQITIVTACRNREANLRQAIQSWLSLSPCQIIICDWGSATPLTHDRLGIEECKHIVDILRCEADRWILAWAFNEALMQVKSEYVLKLDCDHVVSENFVELNQPCFGHFSRGHWRHAEEGQQYINGAFLSCTDLLRRVGYYDERITTYGWDDSDLYTRLYDAGLGSSVFAKGSLRHLDQCETTRTKEQEVSKEGALASHLGIEKTTFLINRNRILCGMLWPWNSNMLKSRDQIRARFVAPEPDEEALIEHATLKAFEMHYQWKGLFGKTGIPAGEAYLEALYAFDQRPCNAPSSLSIAKLLRRYSDAIRNSNEDDKALARIALLANSREARLKSRLEALNNIDELHAASRPENSKNKIKFETKRNHFSPEILVKTPKLYIDAQHGLGNRLRAIGSAAAIAEATDRELVIVWQPDDHCDCRFADLFDYEGAVLDTSCLNDAADCDIYNYMTIEGGVKNAPIRSNGTMDIYARSAFVLNSPHSDGTRENLFIQTLHPVEAVLAMVNSVRHPNDVSVHVRMEGGRKDEHLPYESKTNWTKQDHDLIDHWRSKSHFSHFMKRIDALVAEGAAEHIFIAADQPETYNEFCRNYGDRLAFLQRSIYDRSTVQMQYALADAILLSRAPLLLGSTWSSFSELAHQLSQGCSKLETSGKDF
jgi:hypothetical protein